MHTEEKLGWLFGCWAFIGAIMCAGIAFAIAFTTKDGMGVIGWMIGALGWWLSGVGIIALGKLRAKLDAIEHLADDRSAL